MITMKLSIKPLAFLLIILIALPCAAQDLIPIAKKNDHSSSNEKWGFANRWGELIVPFQYDYVEKFSNGLAFVSVNKENENIESKYIDTTGVTVIYLPPLLSKVNPGYWDGVACREMEHRFSCGRAPVYHADNKKFGFINRKGKVVISCIYDCVGVFSEGLAYVALLENGDKEEVGYINKRGKLKVALPDSLTQDQGDGCYFYGTPFKNGKATMYLVERDRDCFGNWGYSRIEIDKNDNITVKKARYREE